jgi:hypothetical protein
MSGSYSSPVVNSAYSYAVPALGPLARGVSVPLSMGSGLQAVVVDLTNLPPGQQLGALGSIYVDNTQNATAAVVTFPDTQARIDVPAESAIWLLALTGGKRFTLSSAISVTGPVPVYVQVLNQVVPPTGVQPIGGDIIINSGTVQVANPGPAPLALADNSAMVTPGTAYPLLGANTGRRGLIFQCPTSTDGWVSFTGVAAPNTAGSFYVQPGEKFSAPAFCPDQGISIFLNTGSVAVMVPCVQG